MKTQISITGGIAGNRFIFEKLSNYIDQEYISYVSIILYYETEQKAREDLKRAYEKLKIEDPDCQNIKLKSDTLSYGDSKAVIK